MQSWNVSFVERLFPNAKPIRLLSSDYRVKAGFSPPTKNTLKEIESEGVCLKRVFTCEEIPLDPSVKLKVGAQPNYKVLICSKCMKNRWSPSCLECKKKRRTSTCSDCKKNSLSS